MEAYMLLLTLSFFLSSFSLSLSQPDKEFRECRQSPCGKVGVIEYPFWSEESGRPRYCGKSPQFKLKCPQPHEDDYPSIQIGSRTFNVIHLSAYKMRLVPTDFVYDNCSSRLTNTSLSGIPLNPFHYDESSVMNVTLFYGCGPPYYIEGFEFSCHPSTSSSSNSTNYAFFSEDVRKEPRLPDRYNNCKNRIEVPVSIDNAYAQNHSLALQQALGKGFDVEYGVDELCEKCWESDGRCGSNDTSPFICYCLDGHHPLHCSPQPSPYPSDSPSMRLFTLPPPPLKDLCNFITCQTMLHMICDYCILLV